MVTILLRKNIITLEKALLRPAKTTIKKKPTDNHYGNILRKDNSVVTENCNSAPL
jgi:hypothetical protein